MNREYELEVSFPEEADRSYNPLSQKVWRSTGAGEYRVTQSSRWEAREQHERSRRVGAVGERFEGRVDHEEKLHSDGFGLSIS